MGLVSRAGSPAVLLVALVATGGALLGCGSSVADTDAPDPTRRGSAAPNPFCAAAQANLQAIRPLNGLVAQGRASPEQLNNTVTAVRRAGQDMVLAAPAEIQDDVERTVQAVDLQLDALLANGGDQAALMRDPELANRLNSPEFAGAGERVRAYVESNCTGAGAATRR